MKTKEPENWTLILIICLIAIAILSSCNKVNPEPLKPEILYSRMHPPNGKITPWITDVEGNPIKDTTIFIDEITGSVEFKYANEKPKN